MPRERPAGELAAELALGDAHTGFRLRARAGHSDAERVDQPRNGVLLESLRTAPGPVRPPLVDPFVFAAVAALPVGLQAEFRCQLRTDRVDPLPGVVEDGLSLLQQSAARVGLLCGRTRRGLRLLLRHRRPLHGLRLGVHFDRLERLALPPGQDVGEVRERLPTPGDGVDQFRPLRRFGGEHVPERGTRIAGPVAGIELPQQSADLADGAEVADDAPQVRGDLLRLARNELFRVGRLPELRGHLGAPVQHARDPPRHRAERRRLRRPLDRFLQFGEDAQPLLLLFQVPVGRVTQPTAVFARPFAERAQLPVDVVHEPAPGRLDVAVPVVPTGPLPRDLRGPLHRLGDAPGRLSQFVGYRTETRHAAPRCLLGFAHRVPPGLHPSPTSDTAE